MKLLNTFLFIALIMVIVIRCENSEDSSPTGPENHETSIKDTAVSGYWERVSLDETDSAVFKEDTLGVPGIPDSSIRGMEYSVEDGVIYIDSVAAAEYMLTDYEIRTDTLYIEILDPGESPDSSVISDSLYAYVRDYIPPYEFLFDCTWIHYKRGTNYERTIEMKFYRDSTFARETELLYFYAGEIITSRDTGTWEYQSDRFIWLYYGDNETEQLSKKYSSELESEIGYEYGKEI